ncbi:hypothetical protein BOTBODRAFT_35782 [Botryobasidium botryosum FD-172 SS1]|uniref:Thioredoxin domain-containing protein n=1 Tax=Botryobasidium botryosum (strain FD-172 SS1) TaxID=930990 RepID=A0A067MGL2_BOTB1|nr:hypothetical protein BOTBODRAFT_35782 [Botryobasidium botryosum FD-172 SS1]
MALAIEDDNQFDAAVYGVKRPVLALFIDESDQPSQYAVETFEKMSGSFNGIKSIVVDIRKVPEVAGKVYLHTYPVLALFKNGDVVDGVSMVEEGTIALLAARGY